MKRLLLIAVTALAGVSLASVPSSADKPSVNEFCEVVTEQGHFDGKPGKCIAAHRRGAVKFCKDLKDAGLFTDPPVLPPPFDFKNQGDCVSFFMKL